METLKSKHGDRNDRGEISNGITYKYRQQNFSLVIHEIVHFIGVHYGFAERYLATSLLLLFSMSTFAQTNYTILQDAFSKSYAYESRGNFSDAITTMKAVYQEDSYEINLRLGWVTYLAGLFTESSAYYQKAIKLKPMP